MITGEYLPAVMLNFFHTRVRPAAKSQVDGISYASHRKYNHPRFAWEAYEASRVSNLVHKLPYFPPLVPDSGLPVPTPIASSTSARTTRRRRGPEIWVPVEDEYQPPAPDPGPGMWANTWPSRAPTTLTANPVGAPASRQQSPPTTQIPRTTPTPTISTVNQNRAPTSTTRSRVATSTDLADASSLRSSHRPPSSQSATLSASSASQMVPTRWVADVDDPWNGEARSFVVFSGTVPGIYGTWYGTRLWSQ